MHELLDQRVHVLAFFILEKAVGLYRHQLYHEGKVKGRVVAAKVREVVCRHIVQEVSGTAIDGLVHLGDTRHQHLHIFHEEVEVATIGVREGQCRDVLNETVKCATSAHDEHQEELRRPCLHHSHMRLVVSGPPHGFSDLTNLRLEQHELCLHIPFALKAGLEVYLTILDLGLELMSLLLELIALELEAGLLQHHPTVVLLSSSLPLPSDPRVSLNIGHGARGLKVSSVAENPSFHGKETPALCLLVEGGLGGLPLQKDYVGLSANEVLFLWGQLSLAHDALLLAHGGRILADLELPHAEGDQLLCPVGS